MALPKISLDQWATLVSVVESGGYAKAGEALHKSQSTLTYAIQKLEELLGVKAFEIRGRKAVLTPTGEVLYRRGKTLRRRGRTPRARGGRACEGLGSRDPDRGRDPLPYVALGAVPGGVFRGAPRYAHRAFRDRARRHRRGARCTPRRLRHLAQPAGGFPRRSADAAAHTCVAAPSHPLQRLAGRPRSRPAPAPSHRDPDSGLQRKRSAGFLNENAGPCRTRRPRSTPCSWATATPGTRRTRSRASCSVARSPITLREGAERTGSLYLVFADRDAAGPGALRLADIIRAKVKEECSRAPESAPA